MAVVKHQQYDAGCHADVHCDGLNLRANNHVNSWHDVTVLTVPLLSRLQASGLSAGNNYNKTQEAKSAA